MLLTRHAAAAGRRPGGPGLDQRARHDRLRPAGAGPGRRCPARRPPQVREACARWTRLRFAIDATPYPRPDAECSPGRGHVHHDACRCDGTRKTIPGWEYQFTRRARAPAHRLGRADRRRADHRRDPDPADDPAGQEPAAPPGSGRAAGGRAAPLVILDAGYSAAALTAALAGQPVHLLIRLASGSVFYADPVTWPGKHGRPGKHGMPVTCHNDPGQANPEPEESLILPDTPRYGTVRVDAWHQVHPLIHGDRGWFAGWDGKLPVLRGTVLRVTGRAPARRPHPAQDHVAVARRARPAVRRRAMARLPGPLRRRTRLPVRQGHPRADRRQSPHPRSRPTGGSAWSWPPIAQLLLARPLTADLRRPWEKPPDPARPLTPGRVRRGFPDIRCHLGTPAHVAKPTGPGPGRPKGSARGPATRYPVPAKSHQNGQTRNRKQRLTS